jgi:predicted nucleic-acid-binding protein
MSISTIVLCELAWVLKRSYRYHSDEIADAIRRIITSRDVQTDRVAAEVGLRMLGRGGDFADGVIEADAVRARSKHIVTFDQGFARLLGPERGVLLGSDGGDVGVDR